jgi:acid phosphatase type 7
MYFLYKSNHQAWASQFFKKLAGVTMLGIALVACGGGTGSNNTAPTTLQATPNASWELMTAGDIAQCNPLRSSADSNAQKTAQLIERQLASAGSNANVLTLGDNAYLFGLAIGYTTCYRPTWGRFIDKTFAIPGNHDYEKGGENNYFDYFGPKASPAGAGPDRSGYYRLDQNGWTVFALNSNIDARASSAQAQWLKKELVTAKPCVAAAWHHSRFSSSSEGDDVVMIELFDILDSAKADVILQGHQHHYERFSPMTANGVRVTGSGIRSFVVGTGGADNYGFAGVREGSEKQVQAYGVMRWTLDAGKAAWRFIDINDQIRDQGSFNCRAK